MQLVIMWVNMCVSTKLSQAAVTLLQYCTVALVTCILFCNIKYFTSDNYSTTSESHLSYM